MTKEKAEQLAAIQQRILAEGGEMLPGFTISKEKSEQMTIQQRTLAARCEMPGFVVRRFLCLPQT